MSTYHNHRKFYRTPPRWLSELPPEIQEWWIDDWKAHKKKGLYGSTMTYREYTDPSVYLPIEVTYRAVVHTNSGPILSDQMDSIEDALRWRRKARSQAVTGKLAPWGKHSLTGSITDFTSGASWNRRRYEDSIAIRRSNLDNLEQLQRTPSDDHNDVGQ